MKKIIGIILTVFGVVFISFALIFGLCFGGIGFGFSKANEQESDYQNASEYSSCVGTIVSTSRSDSESKTVVNYTVDAVEYQETLSFYSSGYSNGDTVTVYYEISNPSNCKIPEISEAVLGTVGNIFSGIGVVFVIIFGILGIGMLIAGIILIKSAKKENAGI